MNIASQIFSALGAPMAPALFGRDCWLSALPKSDYANLAPYLERSAEHIYLPIIETIGAHEKYGKRHQESGKGNLGLGSLPSTRPETAEGSRFISTIARAERSNETCARVVFSPTDSGGGGQQRCTVFGADDAGRALLEARRAFEFDDRYIAATIVRLRLRLYAMAVRWTRTAALANPCHHIRRKP